MVQGIPVYQVYQVYTVETTQQYIQMKLWLHVLYNNQCKKPVQVVVNSLNYIENHAERTKLSSKDSNIPWTKRGCEWRLKVYYWAIYYRSTLRLLSSSSFPLNIFNFSRSLSSICYFKDSNLCFLFYFSVICTLSILLV